jgi:hypothetical protein
MFPGMNALYLIKMDKAGPRWVFDRATKAGMLDK